MLVSLARSPFAPATGIGLLALTLGPLAPDLSSGGPSSVRPTMSSAVHTASYDVDDPGTWSDRALAAQLSVSCLDVHDVRAARRQAAAGIGGITLLGSSPDRRLAARLGVARRAAAHGVAPFVMSDEEGGRVQRLR